jgi:hypothetical protein
MKIQMLFLSFLISLIPLSAMSQTNTERVFYNYEDILKKSYIKFSPLHLIELEPALMIGYEYPFKKIRIQHEAGYVGLFNPSYGLFYWNGNFTDLTSNGLKLRTTLKFPLLSDNPNRPIKYLGIDFMYKYLTFTDSDVEVWRMNAFTQILDVRSQKHVAAVHLLYGYNGFVSSLNNIISDTYLGIGIRYKSISNNAPEDANYNDYPWWDEYEGAMISLMAGFKFGFGI